MNRICLYPGLGTLIAVLPEMAWAAASPTPGPADLLQLLLGLLVVVGAVIVLARWLPRLQGARAGGSGGLRIVDSLVVGQRERVVLMQVGERQVLLGVTPSQVSTLHLLEEPIEPAAAAAGADAVPWLQRVLTRKPT